MSNYIQSTNFATKDALSSGDPLKIVRGTEIDNEFNAISTAVSTKFDTTALASPGPIGETTPSSINGTTGTFSGAVSGTTGTFSGNVQMASANGGQLAGLRNKIINGKMAVWQRGTSISCPAATLTYTADRFYVIPTGAAVTVTQNTGQTNVFQATLRVTGAASVTAVTIGQRIEATNIADLSGSILATVTLSWYAAASALTTMTYAVGYPTAANTAPYSTSINTGSQAITSTLTRYSKTFTMPAGAVTGVQVEFYLGTFASGTFDISGVQLEIGSVPTPLEQRPIGMELALCQRYFQLVDTRLGGYTQSGVSNQCKHPYPVPMRATPLVTVLASTNTNTTAATVLAAGPSQYMHTSLGSAAGGFISEASAKADAEL